MKLRLSIRFQPRVSLKRTLGWLADRLDRRVRYVLFAALALGTFYAACVHYTDIHQVAITRNVFTGRTTLDRSAGLHLTAPWVKAVRIDTRPMRVCITSSARSYNCRLVQFNLDGWHDFVADQGLHYYWWANRFSLNMGYDEEYRGMRDLLRGYAYGGRPRTFVRVLTEYPDDN